MYVLGVLVGIAAVMALELPGIRRRKQPRELLVFALLTAAATAVPIMWILRWPLPNPTPVLTAIFGPISTWIGIK